MSARSAIERELKLGVWAGFELPDLAGDGLHASAGAERRLRAVHYDTHDLRLLRRGITVRFRTGEPGGDVWTAKLPAETPALGLTRRELSVLAGGEDGVPDELVALTLGWALGASLRPVARIDTLRRTRALRDGAGEQVATLHDDEVSVLRGTRVAARFRELEVELAAAAPAQLLALLERRLRAAGAQAVDQVPKLVRGLGPAAQEPPPLSLADAAGGGGHGASVREAVQVRLLALAARLVDEHAPLATEASPAAVRRSRAAARDLRRDLRAAAPLLDRAAGRALRAELRWLVDALTPLRRLDELDERLPRDGAEGSAGRAARGGAEGLPDVGPLRARLGQARLRALPALSATLASERYAALLASVAGFAQAPPLHAGKAPRAAADVLPRLVRAPLRQLRQAPDDDPRALRKAVTRVRAATAFAAPDAGDELTALHALLRAHAGAEAAVASLASLAASAPELAWTAGLLAGREQVHAEALRERLPDAYERALRRRNWRWVP